MVSGRSHSCLQAFICSSALTVGTNAPSHSGVIRLKNEKKIFGMKDLYRHNMLSEMSLPLFPPLMRLTPSFPTWPRQRELTIGYPFLHAFQGYFSTSFSPPVCLMFLPLSPSIFSLFPLFPPYVSVTTPFSPHFMCPHPSFHADLCRRVQLQLACHRAGESRHPAVHELLLRTQ